MAGSFTTCCASWRPDALAIRTLLTAFCGLALTACGPQEAVNELVKDEINESATRGEVSGAVVDLTVSQLRARLDRGEIRLIDVRTDEEVSEGMIPGAEHIALDSFDPASLDAGDGREIVLYCRSGRRSTVAATKLAEHLDRPVPHLSGGILAWQEAGQAVISP
ncbi:rhodanese-like domain-containing protein [Erythrobacter rubeus]|uniref:Rhodanese-like domain-containing protein n=1 Tax=Erythrobacter rubeus TaxID=2760803 RepID=A0ABR8KN84_9SPHN|nr:rhodanese-like domain-containing protein [Erythrobacter rubeus]MBD2840727.1 rhodanese-like domain-containing protein [Erythrobacter rubeus]